MHFSLPSSDRNGRAGCFKLRLVVSVKRWLYMILLSRVTVISTGRRIVTHVGVLSARIPRQALLVKLSAELVPAACPFRRSHIPCCGGFNCPAGYKSLDCESQPSYSRPPACTTQDGPEWFEISRSCEPCEQKAQKHFRNTPNHTSWRCQGLMGLT